MFFKNKSFQPRTSKQDFQTLTPKFSTLEHILYQNHRIYNLGWPDKIRTQFYVQDLAKNNL